MPLPLPLPTQRHEVLHVNVRTISVTIQTLALVTLQGTIWTYFKVVSFGAQIAVNSVHDFAARVILAGGPFVALLLSGLDTGLGMLCAIFDQQLDSASPRVIVMQGVQQSSCASGKVSR
ncbi:MAG TPA: hypothetical protein VMU68_13220 [Acidimicrobiales bacterium]|nr:hypothetical protein [Acidimicrobiales bacterium]